MNTRYLGAVVVLLAWAASVLHAQDVDTGTGDYVDSGNLPVPYIFNTNDPNDVVEINTGDGTYVEPTGAPVPYLIVKPRRFMGSWRNATDSVWGNRGNWGFGYLPSELVGGTKAISIIGDAGSDPVIDATPNNSDLSMDQLLLTTGTNPSLIINNNRTVTASQSMTIGGAGVTGTATVTVNGAATLSAATLNIASNGVLELNNTATLKVDTLTIAAGGILRIIGTSGASPVIVQPVGAGPVVLTVSGGTLNVSGFSFREVRVVLGGAAVVTKMENGAFAEHPGANDAFIDARTYTGGNLQFVNLAFQNGGTPVVNPYNVRAAAGGPDLVFAGASGLLAGEGFEDDPGNHVHWYSAVPFRLNSLGAAGGKYAILDAANEVNAGVVTVMDNIPHLGALTFDGTTFTQATTTIKRALIVGDVTMNKVGASVTLVNCMIVGTVTAPAGTLTLRHCSVAGNATATTANYCLVSGSLTAGGVESKSGVGTGAFVNSARWDLHVAAGDPAGAIDFASGSAEPDDYDGEGTRPLDAAADAGADESPGFGATGDLIWEFAGTLGPVNYIVRDSPYNLLVVATGRKRGNADATMWENSVVLLDLSTGALQAGLCGAGTLRAAGAGNVGFGGDQTQRLPGAVLKANLWLDNSSPANGLPGFDSATQWCVVLQLLLDTDFDGRSDTVRRYGVAIPKVSRKAANRGSFTGGTLLPLWQEPVGSGTLIDFSIQAKVGPGTGGPFSDAWIIPSAPNPYHLYVTAEDDGNGSAIALRVDGRFNVNPNTSVLTLTDTSAVRPYAASSGIVSYSTNEFYSGLQGGLAADNDLVKLAADLTPTAAVAVQDRLGAAENGLSLMPRAGLSGQTQLLVATPNQWLRRFDMTTTTLDATFGTGGYLGLETDGIVTPGSGTTYLMSPELFFGMSAYFSAYTTNAQKTFFIKTSLSGGTSWISPKYMRGRVIRPVFATPGWQKLFVMTDEGLLYGLNVGDLSFLPGYPIRIAGRDVRTAATNFSTGATAFFSGTSDGRVQARRLEF